MEPLLIVALITGISTAVLAIITTWYAYSTHKHLDESRKQRKIFYLEHRLSKLYSPLVSNPHMLTQWPPPFSSSELKKEEYWSFWQGIRRNFHLGSKALREALIEFLWAIDNHRNSKAQEKATKYRGIIKEIADEEFNQIKDDLESLVKS